MSSENSNVDRQPKKRKKRAHSVAASVFKFILILIMIGIITGCIVASVLTVYVLNTLDVGDSINLEEVKLSFSTIIYAKDSETGEYYELQRVQNTENRIWVDYDQIPQALKDAAVAVEDKRFWTHSGIDLKRTIASAVNLFIPIYEGKPGGSTITQQLIKNLTKDDDFRIDRKIREIFRAINLEKNYSKEQILEAYLNNIALGNAQNGVQSAANLYFNKDVSELTPAECASLIAITQNPTKYNPFTNPENNRERQLMVLRMMHEQQRPDGTPMLTDEEYEEAVNQEMVFKKEEYTQKRETVQDWFVDTLYEEVIDDLVSQAGYTESGASEALRSGGLRIYSTVDPDMQKLLEELYVNPDTFPKIINEEYPESAFVILDLNGQIKAIVGSNREKTGARLFNRATDALLHPGSTIKPIASYSLAVENDLITWSTMIDDNPILLRPNDPTSAFPVNFYGAYLGNIPVTEALQRSCNTAAVKLVQMLGPQQSFNFLTQKLGFQHLVERDIRNGQVFSDIDLSPMALGALTDGVTPLEMAGAYQIFGNGGYYNKPHSYTQVLDSNGKVILENKEIPTRVISEDTATVMNKLMQMVVRGPYGTGKAAAFGNMPIAGKTGTSDNDYNQWFIGVTPYYVGVCWLGYDIAETIRYYSYPPPYIWKTVMSQVHQDLPVKDFPNSPNVVQMTYCLESGNIASSDCTQTAVGWYKLSNTPPVCTSHRQEEPQPGEEGPAPPEDETFDPTDPSDEDGNTMIWRWENHDTFTPDENE